MGDDLVAVMLETVVVLLGYFGSIGHVRSSHRKSGKAFEHGIRGFQNMSGTY